MKKILFLLILIFFFTITGCSDYQDISRTLYVNSLGLDYDQDSKEYILHYHMINPILFSTTELAGSSTEKCYTQTITKGKSIIEAMEIVDANSNQEIRLTHITSFVLSTSFATYDNMLIFYELIKTYSQFYPTANIFVTDDDINKLYDIINVDGISPNFSLISDIDPDSTYKMIKYYDFATAISEDKGLLNFPLIKLNQDIWSVEDKNVNSVEIIGKYYVTKEKELSVFEDNYPGVLYYEEFKANTTVFEDFAVTFEKYKVKVKVKNPKEVIIYITSSGTLQNSSDEEHEKVNLLVKSYLIDFLNYTKENELDVFYIKDKLYRLKKNQNVFDIKKVNFDIVVDIKIYR